MTDFYKYDEASASRADDAASRVTDGGAYVGAFTYAWDVDTQKGGKGIKLGFNVPGTGNCELAIYTMDAEGKANFGKHFLDAMMFFFGLGGLEVKNGKVEKWDDEAKKRVETDGKVFPQLVGKPIGLVLRREIYSRESDGASAERLNLEGVFSPETRLMFSEIKDHKTKPEKLDKLLKIVSKPKDSRKNRGNGGEAAQPSMSGVEPGSY